MNNNNLENLKAAVGSLEQTAEGQLRGGFAVIGGDGPADPLANTKCTNKGCANNGCNECVGASDNIGCDNNGCNGNCVTSPVAKGQTMSLGMTFSL